MRPSPRLAPSPKRSPKFASDAVVVASPARPPRPPRPSPRTRAQSAPGREQATHRDMLRGKAGMYDNLRKAALATRKTEPHAPVLPTPPSQPEPAQPGDPQDSRRLSEQIDSYRSQYTYRLRDKLQYVATTRSDQPRRTSFATALRPTPMEVQFARAKFTRLAVDFKMSREELDLGSWLTPRASEQPGARLGAGGLREQLPGPAAHHALVATSANPPRPRKDERAAAPPPAPAAVEEAGEGEVEGAGEERNGDSGHKPKAPPVPVFHGTPAHEGEAGSGGSKNNSSSSVGGGGGGERRKPSMEGMGFYERVEALKQSRRESESEFRRLSVSINEGVSAVRGSL